jgi:hypothetical protein
MGRAASRFSATVLGVSFRHSLRAPASELGQSRRPGSVRTASDTRLYISSAPLDIDRLANAARGHWGVESMHWLLDVEFKDDLSRYRSGHGAKNMAILRRFALGLVRATKSKRSVKTRRKTGGWNSDYLLELLQLK